MDNNSTQQAQAQALTLLERIWLLRDVWTRIGSMLLMLTICLVVQILQSEVVLQSIFLNYMLCMIIIYYSIIHTGPVVGVTRDHLTEHGDRLLYMGFCVWYTSSSIYHMSQIDQQNWLAISIVVNCGLVTIAVVMWVAEHFERVDPRIMPPWIVQLVFYVYIAVSILPLHYNNAIHSNLYVTMFRAYSYICNYYLYVSLYPPFDPEPNMRCSDSSKNKSLLAYMYLSFVLYMSPGWAVVLSLLQFVYLLYGLGKVHLAKYLESVPLASASSSSSVSSVPGAGSTVLEQEEKV